MKIFNVNANPTGIQLYLDGDGAATSFTADLTKAPFFLDFSLGHPTSFQIQNSGNFTPATTTAAVTVSGTSVILTMTFSDPVPVYGPDGLGGFNTTQFSLTSVYDSLT